MKILAPWKLKESPLPDDQVADLARQANVSLPMAALLVQRGTVTLEAIEEFLNPVPAHMGRLEDWPVLDDAARIISQSLSQGNKAAVWGDYDADGVTSTALLLDFFRKRTGRTIRHFLPHRVDHGYGMNMDVVEQLYAEGIKTIITVDCGITNVHEIARARELGMQVVLTDHHLPGAELPPADVIINPKADQCPHPQLSGVGIAFYLAAQLNYYFEGENINIMQFLDLVALGTIADIVNLDRTNRVLVRQGLKILGTSPRPGLAALKKASGIEGKVKMDSFDIGFGLGPRINAAGRLEHAGLSLNLLIEEDENKAVELAAELNKLNQDRKKVQQDIYELAVRQAESKKDQHGLILCGDGWHPGVIGIAASKVVEETGCPAFVLTRQNGVIKGSGRSVPDVHLFDLMSSMDDLFIKFGGHSQAAGVTLDPENLEAFQERFDAACSKVFSKDRILPRNLDMELPISELSEELLHEIDRLEPYGPENEKPVFLSPELMVTKQRIIGTDGSHLMFELTDEEKDISRNALMWGKAHRWGENSLLHKNIRVSYSPQINEYNGKRDVQIIIDEVLGVA